MRPISLLAGLLAPIAMLAAPASAAPVETVLHSFLSGLDGAYPYAGLSADSAGNLYTTVGLGGYRSKPLCTGGCGTVVRLSPPAAGQTTWTGTVLHYFDAGVDGAVPLAGLFADSAGNLYTTTQGGGYADAGTIVRLAAHNNWREAVLYRFKHVADGHYPEAGLIADRKGNLYTTTAGRNETNETNGTIVELSPPAAGQTAWTETILYRFKGGADGQTPQAGLLADSAGNLYTTTTYGGGASDNGTVVELSPPAAGQTAWTETVIHSFNRGADGAFPYAGLIADSAGNLYTTTFGGGPADDGTVVKLSPPAKGKSAWTETVLYSFKGGTDGRYPQAALIADRAGNLYTTTGEGGTADEDGAVVKLSPPAAGKTAWTETVLYRFKGGADGAGPLAALLADSAGDLYTTTAGGGASNNGTVIKLSGTGFVVAE